MFDDTWKIGDLGLIAFRDKDNIYDKKMILLVLKDGFHQKL